MPNVVTGQHSTPANSAERVMAHGVIVNSAKRHLHSRFRPRPIGHSAFARATNLATSEQDSQGYAAVRPSPAGRTENADERSDSPYFQ